MCCLNIDRLQVELLGFWPSCTSVVIRCASSSFPATSIVLPRVVYSRAVTHLFLNSDKLCLLLIVGCSQGDDPSACESRVVQLLGLDHFELAKELLKNRLKIVWVMKLRQAQDDSEVRNTLGITLHVGSIAVKLF